LINYFKRYSSLGDDRFFVSPRSLETLDWRMRAVVKRT